MSLKLTPTVLIASYEFLRATTPFRGWKLPDADEIIFRVSRDKRDFGLYDMPPRRITVSDSMNGHTQTLLITMAHEMVHLDQCLKEEEIDHGKGFQRRARAICRAHGWDLKAF